MRGCLPRDEPEAGQSPSSRYGWDRAMQPNKIRRTTESAFAAYGGPGMGVERGRRLAGRPDRRLADWLANLIRLPAAWGVSADAWVCDVGVIPSCRRLRVWRRGRANFAAWLRPGCDMGRSGRSSLCSRCWTVRRA